MKQLEDYVAEDPGFWTAGQLAAMAAAHRSAGLSEPGLRAARAWKRQRGPAFEHWRRLSKRRRRALILEAA